MPTRSKPNKAYLGLRSFEFSEQGLLLMSLAPHGWISASIDSSFS